MVSQDAIPAASTGGKESLAEIWGWLEDVPDPEIPVLSVIDLGIVRAVEWDADQLTVFITPTYSGCPAVTVIAMDIEAALVSRGLKNISIKTQLSPAWTTDWIGPQARDKMRAYGIAPPVAGGCIGQAVHAGNQGSIACPQCASTQTERVSQFGSTPCKAAWRCKSCLEPFDYFKPI